jgi:HD-GYP domain-containing protein (c-di-GMP phosphodiesterase class II)
LHKPGALSDDEWVIMKKHPLYAYNMLKEIRFLQKATDIPRYHHEHWNGKGYPYGLKGEEIPLPARIFAIVDCWDALTNDRAYRKKSSHEEALRIIQSSAGKLYDPKIVQIFKRYIEHSLAPLIVDIETDEMAT